LYSNDVCEELVTFGKNSLLHTDWLQTLLQGTKVPSTQNHNVNKTTTQFNPHQVQLSDCPPESDLSPSQSPSLLSDHGRMKPEFCYHEIWTCNHENMSVCNKQVKPHGNNNNNNNNNLPDTLGLSQLYLTPRESLFTTSTTSV